MDAIDLLESDHEQVKELFQVYQELVNSKAADEEKRDLAEQICSMLTVHATLEEEIFYPAADKALDRKGVLYRAEVEHLTAKNLIEEIQQSDPTDELYDAYVQVLGEYVAHHVREEEDELFPLVEESELDLNALGEEMSRRQEELLSA